MRKHYQTGSICENFRRYLLNKFCDIGEELYRPFTIHEPYIPLPNVAAI